MTAAHIKLTANLIQRRDDYKRLCEALGRDYGHVKEFRAIIKGLAARDGIGLADAALKVSKRMSDCGHDPSMIFAALVDECEGA